jgi:hypothetical protein
VRRGLQRFEAEVPLALRLTRIDSGAFVDAASDLSLVPAEVEMSALMGKCLHGEANDDERRRFGQLWQQRVERILLDCWGDDAVFQFRVSPTPG